MKYILIIFFATLFYILPTYLYVDNQNLTFRLDSDYDSIRSTFDYTIKYIRNNASFPQILPYAGYGIPLRGDPSWPLYNPLILLPYILAGFEQGTWIIIIFSTFFSGITMMFFLKSLTSKSTLIIWGCLLYMFSGAFAAKIASGHLVYIYTYALWPILFLMLLKSKRRLIHTLLLSVVFGLFVLSGDLYGTIYGLIFLFISQFYNAIKYPNQRRSQFLHLFILFSCVFIFSSVKIHEAIISMELIGSMSKFFSHRFGQGSIQLPLTILPFIMPWRVLFYDRTFIQQNFGFYFNWYEYYAFISPIPLIFLWKVLRIKNEYKSLLLIYLITGLLFVSQNYPYSPFYWLFKVIPIFLIIHVPQRMYIPLTSIVIALVCISINSIIEVRNSRTKIVVYFLMCLSLLWIFPTNILTMRFGFENKRFREEELIQSLKTYDPTKYFVLNLLTNTQYFLVKNDIYIINYYAGWQNKNNPSFINYDSGLINKDVLDNIKPKYIIAGPSDNFYKYSYSPIIVREQGVVWKTEQENIYPDRLSTNNSD